ncbi:MAG: type II toxin-antitoxin system RelB/DinJ family antitoxin [Treponema sp.]|nr:type II toxin-antitoxin system RelB/DinJ family antitoxin [Treponema sp.]
MAQTLVNIRMDEDLKKSMESICHELGMNLTTAFTIFARKVSREKRIPFDVSVDPFYSEAHLAHLRRGVVALDAGLGKEHELIVEILSCKGHYND